MALAMQQTAHGHPAGEARQVTILKCDVVDSTRITGSVDLDGQLGFERGLHDILKGLAEEFGADMERFEGDGAFLVFGLSRPREDAVRSALQMARALVAAVGGWQPIPGETLRLRVGVSLGPVAAVRDSELHSVAGHTINRAQRLLQAAAPNEILLCEKVRRRAGGHFTYQELGQIPAKGFDEGIAAWRLVGERDITRFEATGSQGVIVGREAMLAAIDDHWRNALAGAPHLLWLSGEAGIGKSRLAHAALAGARASNAITLTLECSPSTVHTPLFPVAVFLRHRAGLTSAMDRDDAADRLRRLLETLLPPDLLDDALQYLGPLLQLPVDAPPPTGLPAEVQERTISLLVGIVASLLAHGPGLLLCEDLHWADDSTLRLVARLCARLEDRPVLILATSRGAPPEALGELTGLTDLPVGPLDAESSHALVRTLAGEAGVAEADADAIVVRSEGVPLLVEELTRAAVDAAAGRGPAEPVGGSVPLSLQLVVESRLVQNPELAMAARTASALGREIHLPLLASLTEMDTATARRLADVGFFDLHAGGERARFRHAMICEAVYETVLGHERRAIHSRVADALLGPFTGAPDATPELLAEHLRRADRFREAVEIRLQAAADTGARGAFVESEGHCRAGLLMCTRLADKDEARNFEFLLTLQMGVAMSGRLGYSAREVEETYLRAYAICGDAEAGALCPIMHGLSGFNLLRGNLRAAYELSLRGLSAAERYEQSLRDLSADERLKGIVLKIDALSMLTYTSFYYRPFGETLDWIERCLDLYEQNDGGSLSYPMPYDAATAALGVLPTVRWMLGDPAGADAAFQRCVDLIERSPRDIDRALMQGWFAGFRVTQQRWSECEAHSEVGQRAGEEFANWRDLAAITKAMSEAHRTRSPQDVRRAIAAMDAYEASGAASNIAHYCAGIARAGIAAGELALARTMVERGLERAAKSEETWMVPELTILKAELEPDATKALPLLRGALEQAEAFGAVAITLLACANLAVRYGLPQATLAGEALAIFAGGEPPEPDWMRPRLAVLREAVRPLTEMTAV